ncbi:MAG: amidase [Desulfobacterales bacterium]
MGNLPLCYTPAVDLARMIKSREISPVELVDAFLDRIDEVNPKVNAFCTITADAAREAAKKAEQAVMDGGELGLLHGVPFSIKDLIYTKAVKTMQGSRMYENDVPDEDAPCVERLKNAGGILMGKTATPEFGHKGVTDSPLTGVTRNPWNLDLTPGGSSGGASAEVAAGMTPLAVGTDGGGSIRIPASLAGIYGLKPSYGRVPVYPPSVLDSLSHAGPMTRTVADAALMLSVMAGPDHRDPVSLEGDPADYSQALNKGIKGLRVAFSPDLGRHRVMPDVADRVKKAAGAFEDLGVTVEEIDPGFPDLDRTFGVFWMAGMAARFAETLAEWEDRMDPLLVQFIQMGQELSAVDFVTAQMQRNEFRDQVRKFFEQYDLLLLPTIATTAFKAGVPVGDALADHPLDDRTWSPFTPAFNLSQNPAASIPAGFTDEGLPVGLMIVGRRFDDLTVLQASAAFEEIMPWAEKLPPI